MAVMTKTPQGEDIVILARKEYDQLIAAVGEDFTDEAMARAALKRLETGNEHSLTLEEMDELLAAKTPLAFYRKRAGMTQTMLAARVGINQGFLSEIENGAKTGDVQTLHKIADSLKISLDDIVVPEAEIPTARKRKKAS